MEALLFETEYDEVSNEMFGVLLRTSSSTAARAITLNL